ncbi:MAG TPA: class I SAM-dependent methyltransferase [Acetivibrio sp.]|uniref:class I SAM-dependent methyltransferase n=1 Tax=Acetivibrio sp. TaxID=1872092 RepID=UPI002C2D7DD6|nr:class I SAM-dependent methyltransferase [Acetivibrio sp.]HOM02628.1 class I SAM-dependent methyltransferase [Acetivibrio sp.]
MSKFSEYIGSQFGNPRGIVGKCCCIIMNVINKAMYRRVVLLVNLTKESNLLDIGYGNGYLLELIYKRYQPNLFGIDISQDMKLSAEKRNARALKDGKLNLILGDCCALPYDENFFDAVTSINTIYFWKDTMEGLKQIHRCLKPDGTFYNVVYAKEWLKKLSYTKKGYKFFEQEDFIEQGKQAGFSKVTIENIVKGKSFVVVYKK